MTLVAKAAASSRAMTTVDDSLPGHVFDGFGQSQVALERFESHVSR
jgi:hypothetical protein